MKTLQILRKAWGIVALVILLGACSETLPPFSLTKGITQKQKNNGTSDGNSWNNNSQNGTDNSQTADKPDLVVVSLEPGDGMPVKGEWEVWEAETYENGVIATIKNEGAADVANLFKVGVYMDNNPNVYYSNVIGSVEISSLKAGETKKIPITISIRNNAQIGKNNYIGFYVDCEGKIKERDEDNNKGGYDKTVNEYQLGGRALHLLHIHENRPDIVALSFNPPSSISKGIQTTASVTIKNTGHRDALALFKVGVYMDDNPNVYYSNVIGSVEVSSLKAGETKDITIPILQNAGFRLNQNWYIGVMVDCNNSIKEMDRERNGDGNYNKGGYNGNTNSYEPGPLLKTVYYSE